MLFTPYYGGPTIPIAVNLELRAAEIIQITVFMGTWFVGRDRTSIDNEIRTIEQEYGDDANSTKEDRNAA